MVKRSSVLSFFLKNSKKGDEYFSRQSDRLMTAMAKHYNKQVKTERIIVFTGSKRKPKCYPLTKVTII